MSNLRRRLIAGLALGFIVILVLALLGDIQQVGDHLTEFTWYLAPIILVCTLFNYTLRFIKWHFYLIQIGVRDLHWRESARLFIAGFPLAVTPGKIGEALKGVWLNKVAGSPTARGITVVLAERISDGFAVLALSSLGVIAYPRYWPAFAIVLGALLVGVLLSQIRPLALALLDFVERLPLVNRIAHHLREFYEGTYTLFRPRATLFAVSLGTVAWFGEGVGRSRGQHRWHARLVDEPSYQHRRRCHLADTVRDLMVWCDAWARGLGFFEGLVVYGRKGLGTERALSHKGTWAPSLLGHDPGRAEVPKCPSTLLIPDPQSLIPFRY
jgi:hypothetical protein